MTTLTNEQRLAALEYAKRAEELAKDAPTNAARSAMNQAVDNIRSFHGYSRKEKVRRIRWLLNHGCSTYTSLAGQTGFDKSEIMKIIGELAEAGEVLLTPLMPSGKGRPTIHITVFRGNRT